MATVMTNAVSSSWVSFIIAAHVTQCSTLQVRALRMDRKHARDSGLKRTT
jgi:hypothetical protein